MVFETLRPIAETTAIFEHSDQTYGYRRVHAQPVRHGEQASLEFVRELMRELDLVACPPRPYRPTATVPGDPDPTPSSTTPPGRPQPHTDTTPSRRPTPHLPPRPLIMRSHTTGNHHAQHEPQPNYT
jgi:hypothetical protein